MLEDWWLPQLLSQTLSRIWLTSTVVKGKHLGFSVFLIILSGEVEIKWHLYISNKSKNNSNIYIRLENDQKNTYDWYKTLQASWPHFCQQQWPIQGKYIFQSNNCYQIKTQKSIQLELRIINIQLQGVLLPSGTTSWQKGCNWAEILSQMSQSAVLCETSRR